MDRIDSTQSGLTTNEALKQLYKDIEQVLTHYEETHKKRELKLILKDVLHNQSQHSTLTWPAILSIFLSALCLMISYLSHPYKSSLIYEALFIILVLFLNLFLVVYDSKQKLVEIPRRVDLVLEEIKEAIAKNDSGWSQENYPHLCSPFSPCITLQWTYRDGKLVNLPLALLVKDDIVVIRAGQISPGYCEAIDKNDDEYPLLHPKQVYGPSLMNANEAITTPKTRKPLENKKYRLIETPYLTNLKMALEQALDKPVTHTNQQRYLLMVKTLEQIFVPIFLGLVLLINFVRYFYLQNFFGAGFWVEMFLIIPVSVTLPLLPIIFPSFWIVLNYYGNARLRTLFDNSNFIGQKKADLFEDPDTTSLNPIEHHCTWRDTLKNFQKIFFGTGHILTRSANLLHVLGSVTALCCVDKKGILSWPNPTAEKVFFLRNLEKTSNSSSLDNVGEINADTDSLDARLCESNQNNFSDHAFAEVLDLTHDQMDPFKLHFDDQEWSQHINSLKPLGLAILLNTCNFNTQEHYSHFCSHITCEAMYNEHLVPVTNRRCLCELAKQIGFSDHAEKIFKLEQQLSTFRHLQPETVRRDSKFARSLQLATKLKFPFPHMVAVVVKEISSGTHQLLSQGTADIIVDSCVDYWDGQDLCPLTPADRKKIQDFYQRTSLTSYCTAFAYRPLNNGCNGKLSQVYLELPSDCKQLFRGNRSPTPIRWSCRTVLEPKFKGAIGQFYSTDSLLFSDTSNQNHTKESSFDIQCNQIFIGMVTMQYQAQADMVHLIEQLERACIRFVHFSKENELRSRVFSEKMGLESGWNCHISLLSERNRSTDHLQINDGKHDVVKTTRESGPVECWANNGTARVCSPTSLPRRGPSHKLSPKPSRQGNYNKLSNLESCKALSFSAPSAINLEHSVVKFESTRDGQHHHTHRHRSIDDSGEGCDIASSEESELMQHTSETERSISPHEHWQSLSCLTDSTEQSAPVNFDMSNRAKLPRGIDKIRPHIQQIDNVPLLVSLFTDCTPSVIREMLHIMQDFGEVVCVMCSSANSDNMGICMQADASIAVEPLYPQVCQKVPVYQQTKTASTPIELARTLNSITCPLSVCREDPFPIYHIIMSARHYMISLWNTIQFWICCCVSLTLIQGITVLLMLPPILRTGNILWLSFIVIPILSVSLMGISTNETVMKQPLGKNQCILTGEVLVFILLCYGAKFVPMIIMVILTFFASLASYCQEICATSNCTCSYVFSPQYPIDQNETTWGGWGQYSYSLFSAQQLALLVIVLHFSTISISFVNRDNNIWAKCPNNNLTWISTVIILLIMHSLYTSINLIVEFKDDQLGFDHISSYVLAFAFCSPLLTFAIVEFVKHKEIKVNRRYQRRARLDFGTKLGMNSPF